MKQEDAQRIADDARTDQRITVQIAKLHGYCVQLSLRRGLRVLVARSWQQWLDIKQVWQGL